MLGGAGAEGGDTVVEGLNSAVIDESRGDEPVTDDESVPGLVTG